MMYEDVLSLTESIHGYLVYHNHAYAWAVGRATPHVVRCATKELGIAPPVERSGGILLPCAVRKY